MTSYNYPLAIKNKEKRNLFIWYFIGIVGLFIALIPRIFTIDAFDLRSALVFLGGTVAIISFIVARMIFVPRAKLMKAMINGEEVLFFWEYSKKEWKKHVDERYTNTKETNIGMLIVVSVICAIVFLPFLIVSKGNKGMLFSFLILIGVLAISAFIGIKMSKKIEENPYVIITNNGVLINKSLYCWKGFGLRFEGAEYNQEDSRIINFNFHVLYARGSSRHTSAAVYIPDGKEEEAGIVIETINRI